MGHGDHRALVVLERPLEPGDRLGVEVVGRLVEEQQVRLGQEQPAEGDPAPLATRERSDVGIARREPQGVHGDLEGAVELPGTGGIDLGLEIGLLGEQGVDVGIGPREGRAHLVEPVDQPLRLAGTLGHVARHVLGLIQLGLLGEVADRETRGQARLAREAVVLTGHDPQQRGLPRAVGPDDPDLRPG